MAIPFDTSDKDLNYLSEVIRRGIQEKVKEVLEEEIKSVSDKVERRVRESVGSVATSVANRMSFERMGQEIIIRVQIEDKKS